MNDMKWSKVAFDLGENSLKICKKKIETKHFHTKIELERQFIFSASFAPAFGFWSFEFRLGSEIIEFERRARTNFV